LNLFYRIVLGVVLVVLLALIAVISFGWNRYRRMLPKPAFRHPASKPDLRAFPDDEVNIAWIGHSTVYINFYGLKIITDPVFSKRIGVSLLRLLTIGMKRHTAPAVDIRDVPELDFVLLSHAHMDHVDLPSLRKLSSPSTTVITATATSRLLKRLHFRRVLELGGRDELDCGDGLIVRAVPVKHWGNRFPWNKTYGWTGYVIAYKDKRVFYSGDTAYTPTFTELQAIFPIDVAILPIGAYAPDSFQRAHCTPEQAWQMFVDTGARKLIPVHWDTFVLSAEPVDEPLQRLLGAAAERTKDIVIRKQGEIFAIRD